MTSEEIIISKEDLEKLSFNSFNDGVSKGIILATKYLESPWKYGQLEYSSGKISWDIEGLKMLKNDLIKLAKTYEKNN